MSDIITKFENRFLQSHYGELEDYLENIFNSPSTINKLLTHYTICYDTNHEYIGIMIKDTFVKQIRLPRKEQLEFMKLKLWIESGMEVHEPTPIFYQGL